MGQPAKPIDPDYDPVLAAFLSAPIVKFTDEERALIEEGKRLHTHYLTTEEMMATVRSLRPADATDDDLDDE